MNKKLQKAYKDYIKFLAKDIEDHAAYLHIHGFKCSQEKIDEGERLRALIEKLEKE